MKKILYLICFAVIIWGCSSNKRPVWVILGNEQLGTFKDNYLTDDQQPGVELHFQKALDEIKKSGNLDLMQRAWLMRMALQVALFQEADQGDYRKIADIRPVPANENYYLFLTGNIDAVDASLLPAQYRRFLKALQKGDIIETEKAVASMKDESLSQLIAAGIAVGQHMESEAIIRTAMDTASQKGWKTALLAWMGRLAAFYEASGDDRGAAEVRRHMDLIDE